jgi:hypothetical protein
MILAVVPADPMDALTLAPRMREPDKVEVTALGHTPFNALMSSFDQKDAEVFSVVEVPDEHEEDDEILEDYQPKVIAMFGVSTSEDGNNYGVPWMLASPELEQHSKQFLRHCRTWIDRLQDKYEVLYNLVHCENAQGMRWLQWCGFEIKTQRTYGQGGENFYLFIREK